MRITAPPAVSVDSLREFIADEQERFAVPGIAVAVIHNAQTLLCDGFGSADLEDSEPVTPDTHFPIASDTKAFTAATLCLLAEQGLVDLDAPIRTVIPWFELHDPHATALVTTRDLLSHRTGLPRHDFVWFGDEPLTPEQITRALRHLPVSRPIRAEWDYNNLCYIAAGHLTEVLTGSSWDTAVQEHLLSPLGMSRAVFSAQDPAIKRIASPYKKSDTGYERQVLPARATAQKAGPAGGLVCTISDLSLWLQARLGQRQDVVPTSALDQLHRPAMLGGITLDLFPEIESLGYGLGCQVESYRGRRIVHHGGNITGFSSDVCVVPGSAVGIAVLTNLDGSYLRLPLLYGILDRLLGLDPIAWGERIHDVETSLKRGHAEALRHHQSVSKPAPPSRALSDFVGAYEHPAYGRLSVSAAEDLLMPEFHGVADQIRLRHRGHDAWDLLFTEADLACPLVFRQDSDGNVIGCSIALEPSVQPITFARVPPQAKDEFVDALVGRYTMGPHALVVRRRGNEIVASTPAVGELLLVSQGDDRFSCPTMPGVVITAERTPTDGVARVVVDGVGVFVRDAE